MALYTVFKAASTFLYIVEMGVFIYVLSTWIAPRSSLRYWLEKFIYPFCAPFQTLSFKIRQRWGSPFDLTYIFTMIALSLADQLLWRLYYILLF